jgi:hypothetical protein
MRRMKKRATFAMLSAALASVALALVAGCNEDMGRLIPNDPPGVRLTATPPDSGTARYDIQFYWDGWDSDGEVDYFLYAIDPPDMYGTEDSIWTRTDDYSGRFIFEASRFDTLYNWKSPQIAKSWHVFVIKAVDDMGAISDPDYVAFNAATVAPRSQFKTPPPAGGIQQYTYRPQIVGMRVTFRWDGDDPDGIFTDKPVGYYFKSVDVTGESKWSQLAKRVRRDTTEWVNFGPEDRTVVLGLDDSHDYAVAVRAIDEAGAVEPLLLLNGNMMWVRAGERFSFPRLTVRSMTFGRRTWLGWTEDTETYEVALGSVYEFTISADASWYGGSITGFSFGWDLDDIESSDTDPDGEGAWTPWSITRTTIPIQFTDGRDYFLYVKCRDDGGGMTLATIRFHVIQLNPTKNLCYIDDWRKYPKTGTTGEPLDDKVWQAMLEGYNYGEDWKDVSWDEWDAIDREGAPSLEFLSQFRVIVWSINDNRSTSINQGSAWCYVNGLSTSNVLAVYMTSRTSTGERGRVWAFGRGLVESAVLAFVGSSCEYPYDVVGNTGCGIREGSFTEEFMHITGEFDGYEKTSGGARISLFDAPDDKAVSVFVDTAGPAIPKDLYTRPPAAELYPDLPLVLPLNPDVASRGKPIYYFEVLEYPGPDQEHEDLFYDPVSEQMTGLIPLYLVHAASTRSRAHNKYCGFRYIPSKPTDPGEIVYFLFPMFPFSDPEIRATAKVVLSDWFGLPDPDAPGAGVAGTGLGGAGTQP